MMNQIAKRLMLAGLLTGVGLWAQAPAEFEAASIKPAAPMEPGRMMIGMRGGPGTPSPGQMTFINVSIAQIMQKAYDVKSYQISGPDWMSSARFDISARVPAGTTKAQFNVMLQSLLADRFKGSEQETVKVYPFIEFALDGSCAAACRMPKLVSWASMFPD